MRCSACHASTRPGVAFGTRCGHRLTPTLSDYLRSHCSTCHAPTRLGVHFGTQCGHRLTPPMSGDLISWRFHERRARSAASRSAR